MVALVLGWKKGMVGGRKKMKGERLRASASRSDEIVISVELE